MADHRNAEKRFKAIEESILDQDAQKLCQTIGQEALEATQVLQALYRGIQRASTLFREKEYSIPELLLSIETFHAGLSFLKETCPDLAVNHQDPKQRTVVIGVIEGDIHDMGKNIVSALLEAYGYQVIDLGRNVVKAAFLDQIKETKAPVLAISTMMSTTLDNVADLIRQAKKRDPEISVIVGGAPFDQQLAGSMGADGYAENAAQVIQELDRSVQVTD